jgi:uncharacterized protein (TIGR03086 family)
MDVIELHRRTVEVFLERVDAIADDQWGDPTPCADWDVRALVNHVVGEDRWTAPLLGGSTIAEVGDRFDGDLLGADPAASASDAAAEAVASVGYHLPTGGKVHLSYGDEDMAEYLTQLTADHLIHGWDVAVATGGDTSLDPELVAAVGAWFAEREELYRGAGIVGPRVDVTGDDPQARLLAASGRDPAWSPPG